jgi:hypothetical protein
MEEKQTHYYDSYRSIGKDHIYLKGTLRYLYDLDKKKEHIKPDEWKLVLFAETVPETVPQQKNKANYGAFVCIFCDYISHDICLVFDESIIAKFQKTIALSILKVGGPAHLFPPFFWFWREIFSFLDGLTVSHVTINQTDQQQTASNFSTPWKLPPPMIGKLRSLSSGAGCLIHN